MSLNKVCTVVGLGRGGIGDHVAKRFSSEGYRVAMVARSNLERLENEIPNSKAYCCDAGNHDQVQSTVDKIITDLGRIDILIYNAGAGVFKTFDQTSVEEFELSWRSGPAGLFSFAKCIVPHMTEGGAIGVTGATASFRGMPVTAAFASAKFATRALAQSLARDLGPKGIHVFHMVIDGVVGLEKTREAMKNKPAEEFLSPEAIADTYWYLSQQPRTCWCQEVNVAPAAAFGTIATI